MWEYLRQQVSPPLLTEVLNDLGAQRWELVVCEWDRDLHNYMLVLKRPKSENVLTEQLVP